MMNPLKSIISKYNEDTLIIVKLDVDTPDIEVPLAHQLLEDDNVNKLVDHFYFEHHVFMREIASAWNSTMRGTIKDSFELMTSLR